MSIDEAAHMVMDFKDCRDDYVLYWVAYHGDRLYSVRDKVTGIVSLVYADYPRDAIRKVEGEEHEI